MNIAICDFCELYITSEQLYGIHKGKERLTPYHKDCVQKYMKTKSILDRAKFAFKYREKPTAQSPIQRIQEAALVIAAALIVPVWRAIDREDYTLIIILGVIAVLALVGSYFLIKRRESKETEKWKELESQLLESSEGEMI